MSYQDVYIFTHQKQFSFHAREEILHHIDVPEKKLVDKGGGKELQWFSGVSTTHGIYQQIIPIRRDQQSDFVVCSSQWDSPGNVT